MTKRKTEYDFEALLQMSDQERLQQPPQTPARGKRQRRTSDVIDSMGESPLQYSPVASTSTRGFGSGGPSTPSSSIGYVTPQRPAHTYWHTTVSPDHGYCSPELTKSAPSPPEWTYSQPCTSQDGSEPDTSVVQFPSSMYTAPGDPATNDVPPSLRYPVSGKMTVHKDSDRYNMQHGNRGKCVVFNHETFDTGFGPRQGTSADAHRIEQTFRKLGFTVEICDDFEHSAIISKIHELSDEDHTDNDCLCIFVLTHGMMNDFILAKDVAYKSEHIWKPFTADKCTTLAGKPKLFFFQACRGDNLDSGVNLYRVEIPKTETDSFSDSFSYKIPTHADFLFAHSTAQGFYSWRDLEEGTWYVQSLCDILDKYSATTDLAKMLTMTARKVAIDFASSHPIDSSLHDQKQVPSVTSMLIRDLYFTPKGQ